MPYEAKSIDILPGIFKEATEYASQNRWVDGSNVRFWKGFPERIGGNTTICDPRALRPPRGMVAWRALDGTQLIAFGHAYGVEVHEGGSLYDVTAQGTGGYARLTVATGAVAGGPFQTDEEVTTVAGASGYLTQASASSPLYVSAHNGTHALALTGMSGTFISGETVTGTTGEARVIIGGSGSPVYVYDWDGVAFTGTVTGAQSGATGTYSSLTELWTGTVTGGTSGATATISSYSDTNATNGSTTVPWGGGTWGSGVWGGTEGIFATGIEPATWTLALWGEDLIGCPRGGNIYQLDTSAFIGATTTNMALLTNAPTNNLGVFMNDENRTLVVYGANSDPVNIAWCDEEDNTTWTPATSNTAGSIRCEDGSTIVGHMTHPQGHLISTDSAVYLFRYVGLPFVFGLTRIARGSTMIGPMAGVEADGITYWMGQNGFYLYNGSVLPLPCDVHAYVFGRLNLAQAYEVTCGTLKAYNEVWWFYASKDSVDGEVDSYVVYNYVEQHWHVGTKARTSWIDSSVVLPYPLGTKADGSIHAEELGKTDDGAAISYTLETHDIEVGDGTTFLHNRKLITDYDRIEGTHTVSIEARGWPSRAPVTKGPYSITSATEEISVRARGRTLRFSFAGSDDFRLGRWRYRVTGHGARP